MSLFDASRQRHAQTDSSHANMISPLAKWLLQMYALALLATHLKSPVCANSHEMLDEVASLQGNNDDSAADDSALQLIDEVKRSWKSLQGSWGKRDQAESLPLQEDYDSQIPEWTASGRSENNDHPDVLKYSVIYASDPKTLAAAVAAAALAPTSNGEAISGHNFEKKSWKNMNVAWGKRRSAVWNKFRGAWGKREPGWNNLKGMWGKRSTGDWKKLQSAWGKRTMPQ